MQHHSRPRCCAVLAVLPITPLPYRAADTHLAALPPNTQRSSAVVGGIAVPLQLPSEPLPAGESFVDYDLRCISPHPPLTAHDSEKKKHCPSPRLVAHRDGRASIAGTLQTHTTCHVLVLISVALAVCCRRPSPAQDASLGGPATAGLPSGTRAHAHALHVAQP